MDISIGYRYSWWLSDCAKELANLTLCIVLVGQQAQEAGMVPAQTEWLKKLDAGQGHLWTVQLIDR